MYDYSDYMTADETFLSVRNFIKALNDYKTDRMIAFDGHITAMIGYGVQLCYDVDEKIARCCVDNIDKFKTLADWQKFVQDLKEAVQEHEPFANDIEWRSWLWVFVDERTREEMPTMSFT